MRLDAKQLVVLAGLAALIGAVGLASVLSSNYNDVSSLSSVNSEIRVTVQGSPTNLGTGTLILNVGDEEYMLDARGVYAIPLGELEGYVLFVLEGEDGFRVAALYPAKDFVARYGGSPIVESLVVVDGIYDPNTMVIIEDPEAGKIQQLPVLWINIILKGCHSSYQQQPANA